MNTYPTWHPGPSSGAEKRAGGANKGPKPKTWPKVEFMVGVGGPAPAKKNCHAGFNLLANGKPELGLEKAATNSQVTDKLRLSQFRRMEEDRLERKRGKEEEGGRKRRRNDENEEESGEGEAMVKKK